MDYAIWGTVSPRAGVSYHDLYRQHLDEIEQADRGGFAHHWFFGHHMSTTAPTPAAPVTPPTLMIAGGAARTRRISLGNMVNVLPYRNPLLVAEEATMLDQM